MKKFWAATFLCCIAFVTVAQRDISDDTPKTFKERGYFGGGFGLSGGRDAFGNNYFFIALNPIIGYMVKPQFSVGTGINWQRTSYSDLGINLDQYGVSPFARYNFGGQMFGYAEYNYISTPTFINRNERRSFNRMLLGLVMRSHWAAVVPLTWWHCTMCSTIRQTARSRLLGCFGCSFLFS